MKPLLKIPTLRSALIRLHRDLFQTDQFVSWWVSTEPLSNLERLVLVLEDRRFLQHRGFDARACVRELLKMLTLRKHGGASTIDMQFVRTATGYKQYTAKRKLYEMLLAFLIHFRYTKIEILRSYLSCAFFGSHLIGAERASRKVFSKSCGDLTDSEAAFIAAMLVYPRPLEPKDGWDRRVRNRADYGLRRIARFEESFEKIAR